MLCGANRLRRVIEQHRDRSAPDTDLAAVGSFAALDAAAAARDGRVDGHVAVDLGSQACNQDPVLARAGVAKLLDRVARLLRRLRRCSVRGHAHLRMWHVPWSPQAGRLLATKASAIDQ